MTLIGGGIQGEAVRYAGTDIRSLGVYLAAIDGVASLPPVRGQNLLIPYQQGTRWVPKFYGERPVVLAGEFLSLVSRADMFTKLDTLKALFPIASGEQKLEVQRQDGTFRYIMAEVRNTMGLQSVLFPTRDMPFSIELVASDPFWYSLVLAAGHGLSAWTLDSGVFLDDGAHWLNQTIGVGFVQTLTQQATVVNAPNLGNAPNRRPVFTLTGAMTNPKITNLRNGTSIQVKDTSAIPGQVLVIDCGAQTATQGGYRVPGSILVSSDSDWLRLEVGDNSLNVDVGIAAPSVTYRADYSAAYL